MKYLCEGCDRLAEPKGFRQHAGMLVLTCARCGAQTRAVWAEASAETAAAAVPHSPASAPAPPPARVVPLHAVPPLSHSGEDPFAVPADRCPKCVAPRPPSAGPSCPQCGLVFANFVAAESEPSPELRAAWAELAGKWDDLAAHDRTVASASARGELAAVGRLYRIHLARQPRDPVATRGRDEVLRRAATSSPLLPGASLVPGQTAQPPINAELVKKVLFAVVTLWLAGSLVLLGYWAFVRA